MDEFRNIKVTEAWDIPKWKQRTITFKNGVEYVGPWYFYQGINPILGHAKATLYNKEGGTFTPGHFKVKPIVHYSSVTESPSTFVTINRYAYGGLRRYLEIEGPIAALTPGPNWDTRYLGLHNFTDVDFYALLSAVAKSRETPALIGVTLGEAGETLDMLGGSLSKAGKALKKLGAPGIARRGRRLLDFVTNQWLQYQYGIIPTMLEVDAYRKLVDKKFNVDFGPILKSRAGSGQPVKTVSPFVKSPNGGWYAVGKTEVVTREQLSATVYTRRRFNTGMTMGASVYDVPTTIYELLPYSFVLDWVYDVGTWLRAMTPHEGVQDLGNCLSYTSSASLNVVVQKAGMYPEPTFNFPHTTVNCGASLQRRTYYRLANQPLPALPQVKFPITSLQRTASALSLMWGNLTNHLPRR